MDKLSEISIDFSQNEANVIDEQNVNAVWVDLDKGNFVIILLVHKIFKFLYRFAI